MEDVNHINLTDPTTESVYCHYQGDVVKFDGVHVATVCWGCPFWGGLAGGFGVNCVYDDPNATAAEVTYNKPNAAKAEAPEPAEDHDSVASQAGIASRDARVAMSPVEEGSTEEAPVAEEETPAEEVAPEEEVPEEAPAEASAKPAPKSASPFPLKKKAPFPPQKKATTADVLTEIAKAKK